MFIKVETIICKSCGQDFIGSVSIDLPPIELCNDCKSKIKGTERE